MLSRLVPWGDIKKTENQWCSKQVGRVGLAYPEFGSSVDPIPTRGADYAHYITAYPPGFENLTASEKIRVCELKNNTQVWDNGVLNSDPGLKAFWPLDRLKLESYQKA